MQSPPKSDEATLARTAPATYSNRVYVDSIDGLVRIAFGEVSEGGPVNYRQAVVLTPANAVALQDLLGTIVKRVHEGPSSTN